MGLSFTLFVNLFDVLFNLIEENETGFLMRSFWTYLTW